MRRGDRGQRGRGAPPATSWRCPACCGARPPSSGGSRGARRPATRSSDAAQRLGRRRPSPDRGEVEHGQGDVRAAGTRRDQRRRGRRCSVSAPVRSTAVTARTIGDGGAAGPAGRPPPTGPERPGRRRRGRHRRRRRGAPRHRPRHGGAVGARPDGPTPDPAAVERALYDDRTVVRMLGMRRTLFTMPRRPGPRRPGVVHARGGRRRAPQAGGPHRGGRAGLAGGAVAAPARAQDAGRARGAGRGRGHRSSPPSVPDLGRKVVVAPGTRNAANVEPHLAGPAPPRRRRPGRAGPTAGPVDVEPAPLGAHRPAGSARRWPSSTRPRRRSRWPGAGWSGSARAPWPTSSGGPGGPSAPPAPPLAALDTVAVDLDGEAGLVLAGDEAPVAAPEPWVALLPGLDPTAMGWPARDWYLPQAHRPQRDGPHRQHRPDGVGRRPRRRRVGAAQGRRDRGAAAGGRRARPRAASSAPPCATSSGRSATSG